MMEDLSLTIGRRIELRNTEKKGRFIRVGQEKRYKHLYISSL